MAPTLAVRGTVSVIRTTYETVRALTEQHLPDSLERRESLSSLREWMELAMRGALDQADADHPRQSDR